MKADRFSFGSKCLGIEVVDDGIESLRRVERIKAFFKFVFDLEDLTLPAAGKLKFETAAVFVIKFELKCAVRCRENFRLKS